MGGIKVVVDESKVKEAVKLLLEGIGEDPEREGLKDTPDRIARMYTELMAGYDDKPSNHLSRTFRAENNEMVLEKDIVFYSMCEHHMMPFFGKAHIAYIPNGKVVGLSKLARCVETYARRLQIQEKMTAQIADAIMDELQPQGVMIVVEAEHLCMTARGVKKPGSKTTTVVTRGVFADNEKLQTLFFRLLNERIEGLPDENR